MNSQLVIPFQFVQGSGLASWAIRWKTDAEFSHVNIRTPDNKLIGSLMKGGVQVRPLDYDTWKKQVYVFVPVTEEQYHLFWEDALADVGMKYDRAGIVGIALGTNLHNPKQSFCSEWGTRKVNQDSKARIVTIRKDPSKIDPDTLRLILSAIPGAWEEHIPAAPGDVQFYAAAAV